MEDDMRLKACFLDGVFKGMATVLFCVVVVIVLLWAMFFSEEDKYKMVCEPCAILQEVE